MLHPVTISHHKYYKCFYTCDIRFCIHRKRDRATGNQGAREEFPGRNSLTCFSKLIISTVTTVTNKGKMYLKDNAVMYLSSVTVIYKIVQTVTNCYKLLQPFTMAVMKMETNIIKGCNSCNSR